MKLTQDELKKIEKIGIKVLILFGSQAQGVAGKASDYDFLVMGQNSKEIYDRLSDLLSERINKLVDIDIVFDGDAPMELKNHVVKYGQVLFEKMPNTFANFKEKVIIDSADFAYYRKIFQTATLSRIP